MARRSRFGPPDLHVHVHEQGPAGLLLVFALGAQPGHVGLLDLHHLLLNDKDGVGMVAYLSRERSGLYHWPRTAGRETRSLLRFLLRCDVSYLAGKLKLDDHFDRDLTREAVERELREGNPDEADELLESFIATSREDLTYWMLTAAPRGPGRREDRFRPVETIDPSFHALYAWAWPWMREHADEIEAALYPGGVPA